MSSVIAGLPATGSHSPLTQRVKVRRATPDDAHDIVRIACSVGNSVQDPSLGFLLFNYASDPVRFRNEFARKTLELDHFYVAEAKRVCGFLMAYCRDTWLEYSPDWQRNIHWHPEFDKGDLDRFVVVEKTAVMAGLTGQGIGSTLYERLLGDLRLKGIENIFAETVIAPAPNYASLEFRRKQKYRLVGVRYESIDGTTYTSLVYMKKLPGSGSGA
ncbi:MAG: N-acetyltransferase family protein [Ignavibacteriales bacterium]